MRLLVIAAFVLASVAPAHAYIDAGSGSYVLQLAMAGILAFAFTLKIAWGRLTAYVGGLLYSHRNLDKHVVE